MSYLERPKSLIQECYNHLREAEETYLQHALFTVRIAAKLWLCGIAILLHGLVPGLFRRTVSRQITALYARLSARNPSAERTASAEETLVEWHI